MNSTQPSANSQACSSAPSYLSIDVRLTTQPFGENGDSNFEVVMNALSHYKFHLLEHAKRHSSEIASHGDYSVQLDTLNEVEQISDLQNDMQLKMIVADQRRVKPKADLLETEDTPALAIEQADQPAHLKTSLQSKYDVLHESIKAFLLEEGIQSHLDRLSQLWNHWSVYGIGDGEGDPNAIHQVSSKSLDDTFSVMRLMCFLSSIGETWSSIQRLADQSGGKQS